MFFKKSPYNIYKLMDYSDFSKNRKLDLLITPIECLEEGEYTTNGDVW